ncbi:MAG: hypothetical protein ACE5I1_32765 [bacterium]
MSTAVPIDFNQLKLQIMQFNLKQKIELIEILEKDTFPVRFKEFLNKVKTNDLDLDEITAEVETVRKRRYDTKRKN